MSDQATAAADEWALVEIFGHRRHVGRVSEVERFGSKMLRVDVPTVGDEGTYETHYYGGASIFSMTPMSEEGARAWIARYAPRPAGVASLPHQRSWDHEGGADGEAPDDDDDDRPF